MQHTTSPMMFKKVRTQLFSTQRPNTAAAAPNQVSSTGHRRSRNFATKPIINPETAAIAMRCRANLAFRRPTQKKHEKKQILRHYVWYGTCHNRHQLHLLKYKPCHTECPWQLPKSCVRHAILGVKWSNPGDPRFRMIWPVQSGLRLPDVDHNKTSWPCTISEHLLQVMVMLRKQNHLPTYIKRAEKKACVKSTTQMPDVVKSGILRNHNGLAFFLCQIGFIATPKPRVDTLMTVWHNQNYLGGSQSKSKRRIAWSLQQLSNIQILRVGQHAAPSISHPSWPWMLHFRQKLENALLPGMTYEQIAIQALWISHQSPAHQSSISCHRLDVLLIHRVDAWSIPESCPFPFCGPLWNPGFSKKKDEKGMVYSKSSITHNPNALGLKDRMHSFHPATESCRLG